MVIRDKKWEVLKKVFIQHPCFYVLTYIKNFDSFNDVISIYNNYVNKYLKLINIIINWVPYWVPLT